MTSKVLASFENADRSHCVDIFVRADGSYGFEEFRAAADGDARWQPLAKYSTLRFSSGDAALRSAQTHVQWLDKSEVWRW